MQALSVIIRFPVAVYYLLSKRAVFILVNLRFAFRDLRFKSIEKIARENIYHMALSFWEALKINCWNKNDLEKIVTLDVEKSVWDRIKEGGNILLGIHMGSWEIVNNFLGTHFPYALVVETKG